MHGCVQVREVEHTCRKDDTGQWRRRQSLIRRSVKSPDWYVTDGAVRVQVRDTIKADSLYLADIGGALTPVLSL